MTKRIVSGLFLLTALGALGLILAGALSSGEQLVVRFLTAIVVAALGLYVISDLRLQSNDSAAAASGPRTTPVSGAGQTTAAAPPPANSTAAFMATVTGRRALSTAELDEERRHPAGPPPPAAMVTSEMAQVEATGPVPTVHLDPPESQLGPDLDEVSAWPRPVARIVPAEDDGADDNLGLPARPVNQAAAFILDDAAEEPEADPCIETIDPPTAEPDIAHHRANTSSAATEVHLPDPPITSRHSNDYGFGATYLDSGSGDAVLDDRDVSDSDVGNSDVTDADVADADATGDIEEFEAENESDIQDTRVQDDGEAEGVEADLEWTESPPSADATTTGTASVNGRSQMLEFHSVGLPKGHDGASATDGETASLPDRISQLRAASYANAPLSPVLDLVTRNQHPSSEIEKAIQSGESDVIDSLVDQGLLSTSGPLSDRDVRTMVYVAFTSSELRQILVNGGTVDGDNSDVELGPIELFPSTAPVIDLVQPRPALTAAPPAADTTETDESDDNRADIDPSSLDTADSVVMG